MESRANPTAEPPFRPVPPLVIGLLGGVAAGKSAVSALFAAHGLEVLDADRIARDVTRRPDVVAQIAARFGEGVLAADGSLARAAVAAIVFRDPAARRDLEALVHPPVRAELVARTRAAVAAGTSVLLDVPLLLENGLIELCDTCVFVEVPRAVREARAKARGWDDGELARREANQADLALKKARCAHTIPNDGALHATADHVRALLHQLGSTPRIRS